MNLIFDENIGHLTSVCFTPHSVNLPQHCRGSLGYIRVLRTRAVRILSKVYLVYCTNTCLIMVQFTICVILLICGSKKYNGFDSAAPVVLGDYSWDIFIILYCTYSIYYFVLGPSRYFYFSFITVDS